MSNKIAEMMAKAYDESRPVTAHLEITYKCNLLCSFCYNAPREERELNGDEWIDSIRKCKEAGSYTVILSGGEPMVHRDFWKICEGVRDMRMVLKTYTNGVALADRKKAERYAELAPFDTEISLHGSTAQVHDRLTGIRGSFDKLLVALGHLSDLGVKVSLKTPITRLNQSQLKDIEALGKRYGYPITYDTNILPTDDGDTSTFSLAPDRQFLADFFVDQVKRGARGLKPRPVGKMKQNCGTGRTVITIDPYGEIFPCVAWRRSLGNIREVEDVRELWHPKQTPMNANLAYVRKVADEVPKRTLAGAEEGGFASFCPAAAEKETGDAFNFYGAARMSGLTKLDAYKRIQEEKSDTSPSQDSVASSTGTA